MKIKPQSCIYILNENPLYHAMYSVSIRSLRKHNPDIPVTLLYVYDSNQDSWSPSNGLFKDIPPYFTQNFMYFKQEEVLKISKDLNVDIVPIHGLPYKSQNYVSIQRCLFSDMDFEDVLLLDVDTFFLRPIQFLFDKYKNFDFVACPFVAYDAEKNVMVKQSMRFIYNKNNTIEKQFLLPYNSGVVLWKGNLLQQYGKKVLNYCNDILYKKHPMADMIYSLRDDVRNREEMACNLFILEHDVNHGFFDPDDVAIVEHRESAALIHSTSVYFPPLFTTLAMNNKLVINFHQNT